ncbi:unnamed protein product [Auanema sp. JU1783]|nr:unnamed protein product [Auanema sp. JU1783]
MSEKKLTYKQKAAISFIQQDDPPFIKQMKLKMGYKEGPKLEDKFVDEDAVEEVETTEGFLNHIIVLIFSRFSVVVLNPETDLNPEDLKDALEAKKKEIDEKMIADGKITFKKPVKRLAEETDEEVSKKKLYKEKKVIKEPESRLLSFGEDEEED